MRQSQDGRTALMSACEEGRIDCLRVLLQGGADTEATENVRVFK
jgi:ankyrin repeat protein